MRVSDWLHLARRQFQVEFMSPAASIATDSTHWPLLSCSRLLKSWKAQMQRQLMEPRLGVRQGRKRLLPGSVFRATHSTCRAKVQGSPIGFGVVDPGNALLEQSARHDRLTMSRYPSLHHSSKTRGGTHSNGSVAFVIFRVQQLGCCDKASSSQVNQFFLHAMTSLVLNNDDSMLKAWFLSPKRTDPKRLLKLMYSRRICIMTASSHEKSAAKRPRRSPDSCQCCRPRSCRERPGRRSVRGPARKKRLQLCQASTFASWSWPVPSSQKVLQPWQQSSWTKG